MITTGKHRELLMNMGIDVEYNYLSVSYTLTNEIVVLVSFNRKTGVAAEYVS